MAAYPITHAQVTDGVAVVATLTNTPVQPGVSVTITNAGQYNGTHLVTACPAYFLIGVDQYGDYVYDPAILIGNQIAFALNVANTARAATAGTVTYTPVCTWITLGDIEDWLGFVFTNPSSDRDLALIAVGAANQFAWRRRQEAGYSDSLSTVPSDDVKLGTIMYGGYLYRMRGSIDNYASFDPMATGAPVGGSFGDILRLLGCNRPAVA